LQSYTVQEERFPHVSNCAFPHLRRNLSSSIDKLLTPIKISKENLPRRHVRELSFELSIVYFWAVIYCTLLHY
jgi:hypothetical protein